MASNRIKNHVESLHGRDAVGTLPSEQEQGEGQSTDNSQGQDSSDVERDTERLEPPKTDIGQNL